MYHIGTSVERYIRAFLAELAAAPRYFGAR